MNSLFRRWPLAWCLPLILIAGAPPTLAAQDASPLDEEGRLVDFQRDIAPIFRHHCVECHGAVRPKNDFRMDQAEMVLDYLEPGDVEGSFLFTDYMLSEDPDMLMPPPDHSRLTPAQLALVHVWISEGAHWPEDFVIPAPAETEETTETVVPPEPAGPVESRTLLTRIWIFKGYFHPATIHFPIALLMFGALFVVLGWRWPTLGTQIPLACLLLGAVAAIGASAMGWSLATTQGYGGWTRGMDAPIFWHRWAGVLVAVLASLFAVVALVALRRPSLRLNQVWKGGLLVTALLVGWVGHQGGELVYGTTFYQEAFRHLRGVAKEPLQPVGEPAEAGDPGDEEEEPAEEDEAA